MTSAYNLIKTKNGKQRQPWNDGLHVYQLPMKNDVRSVNDETFPDKLYTNRFATFAQLKQTSICAVFCLFSINSYRRLLHIDGLVVLSHSTDEGASPSFLVGYTYSNLKTILIQNLVRFRCSCLLFRI